MKENLSKISVGKILTKEEAEQVVGGVRLMDTTGSGSGPRVVPEIKLMDITGSGSGPRIGGGGPRFIF